MLPKTKNRLIVFPVLILLYAWPKRGLREGGEETVSLVFGLLVVVTNISGQETEGLYYLGMVEVLVCCLSLYANYLSSEADNAQVNNLHLTKNKLKSLNCI